MSSLLKKIAVAFVIALSTTALTVPAQAETIYTRADVRAHALPTDCWTIVSGGVYNLTTFIARHEGGRTVIIGMCGVDATVGFLAQHAGESQPTRTLTAYRIGALDPTAVPTPTTSYTIGQIRPHNVATDCWSAVSGGVYDLTAWIAVHPGGQAVVKGMCGIDATVAFLAQHRGDANPIAILEQFKIGIFDPTVPPVENKYTLAQVKLHNTGADCWSIVRTNVYDLTTWIVAHPGGQAVITGMCGLDATTAYLGQHQNSQTALATLEQFKIGLLDDSTPPPPADQKYTLAQVKLHNTPGDCWSIVKTNVYDLTSWINAHPGGPAFIKAMCGINATTAYLGQHQNSQAALAALEQFKIGVFSGAPAPTKYFTMATVRQHNSRSNCWTVISGKVYNLTKWIANHPGGSEAIIELCGINGTSGFLEGHNGDKAAIAQLASFKIGVLKTSTPKPAAKAYTKAQVATHKTAGNCWSIVGTSVYNLTKWIPLHPGGQAQIKAMCGVDATAGFNGQHSGSASAKASIAKYKIGSYKKSASPTPTPTTKYTAKVVATHNTAGNCWSIVSGSVYNLTKWIPLHPGGQAQIKAMCGRDATAGFTGQHSASASAKASLANYKIGVVTGGSTPTPTPTPVNKYTLTQVKTHSSSTNCWAAANGSVYSLTAWIRKQPSINASTICGKDATAALKKKYGSTSAVTSALKLYKIGALK
jgi:hypothetical protein